MKGMTASETGFLENRIIFCLYIDSKKKSKTYKGYPILSVDIYFGLSCEIYCFFFLSGT